MDGAGAAVPSTLIRRPPQQLEKHGNLSILSIKTWLYHKNSVFDANTPHQCPMSGQVPAHLYGIGIYLSTEHSIPRGQSSDPCADRTVCMCSQTNFRLNKIPQKIVTW